MRKLLALLAALVLALGACGGDDTDPAGHDHDSHSHEDEGDAHTHEVDIGHADDPAKADRKIKVVATDYSFDPSSIAVEEGEIIEFVVTNEGRVPHEFTIGDQAFHNSASGEMHDHGDQSTGVLEPGESGSLTWNFTTVANVLFACHVEDHFQRNMFGSVRVLL